MSFARVFRQLKPPFEEAEDAATLHLSAERVHVYLGGSA